MQEGARGSKAGVYFQLLLSVPHCLVSDFDVYVHVYQLLQVHRLKPPVARCFGATDVTKRHMVAVNVSPIARGHVLLVPEPTSCLPQVN